MEFEVGAKVRVVNDMEGSGNGGKCGFIEVDYRKTPRLCAFRDYGVRIGDEVLDFNEDELSAVNVTVIEGVVERDTLGTVYVAIDGKPYMARHIDYLVAQAIMPSKKYRMTLTIEEVPTLRR